MSVQATYAKEPQLLQSDCMSPQPATKRGINFTATRASLLFHTVFCAVYRPVDQELNVSKIANVQQWFPNLAEVAKLDPEEPLLFMHDVYRAKIVWTVLFNGVIGEVGMVRPTGGPGACCTVHA